jgi:hypothetical protein
MSSDMRNDEIPEDTLIKGESIIHSKKQEPQKERRATTMQMLYMYRGKGSTCGQ